MGTRGAELHHKSQKLQNLIKRYKTVDFLLGVWYNADSCVEKANGQDKVEGKAEDGNRVRVF